jgi:acyl carrier protein
VVEEEFGLQIDPLDLPDLGSFRAISDYLHAVLSDAA